MFQEREGSVLIGVCDLFIKTIEQIPKLNFKMWKMKLHRVYAVHQLNAVMIEFIKYFHRFQVGLLKINKNIKSNPNFIEKDPYFEGWIYRVIPSNIDYETKFLIPCSSDRL